MHIVSETMPVLSSEITKDNPSPRLYARVCFF